MAEDEHAHAAGVIEALRKGETIAGTAYADDYRRLDGGVDHVLHALDALVRPSYPRRSAPTYVGTVASASGCGSLGEPEAVGYAPRQEAERLEVEIELQGAFPTPAERFPRREFG